MLSIHFSAAWSVTMTCLNWGEMAQKKWRSMNTTHHASMRDTSHLSCVLVSARDA